MDAGDLMQPVSSGASPLARITTVDLSVIHADLDDMDVDLVQQACDRLGKPHPDEATGLARINGTAWMFVPVALFFLGFIGGFKQFDGGNAVVGVLGLVLAAGCVGVMIWAQKLAKEFAQLEEIRSEVLALGNEGAATEYVEKANGEAMWQLADLPDGNTRKQPWLEDRLRITHTDGLALERGSYCYQMKSSDSDGGSSTRTVKLMYLFVPLPPDIRERVSHWFFIAKRGDRDVSLSSAFDDEFRVDTIDDDDEAALFVTRVLAPDVQELILRYEVDKRHGIRFTTEGVFLFFPGTAVAKKALKNMMSRGSKHDVITPDQWLSQSLHLVHEMFEQINPAYKLDRAEKANLLESVGLQPA